MTDDSNPRHPLDSKAVFRLQMMTTGILKYPIIKMHRDSNTLYNVSVNRFFKLRNYIHCVDNNDTGKSDVDKLWKVRPIYI